MATMVGAAPLGAGPHAAGTRGPSDGRGPADVADALAKLGVALKPAWVAACVAHLERADPRFPAMPLHQRVEACYLQFLEADLNLAGAGSLPNPFPPGGGCPDSNPGGAQPPPRVLAGRFVLQADEALNVAASHNERYAEKPARLDRVMKLALTDGRTRVTAYEYRPVPALGPSRPAGVKLAVTDAMLSPDGDALFLTPESVVVLGGRVAVLEEARGRALARWRAPNEPEPQPRPNRRRGTDEGSEPRPGPGARMKKAEAMALAAREAFELEGGNRAGVDDATAAAAAAPFAAEPPEASAPRRANQTANQAAARAPGEEEEESARAAAAAAPIARTTRSSVPTAPEEASEPPPAVRVKRKRVVRIDDSDEDPTQTRRSAREARTTSGGESGGPTGGGPSTGGAPSTGGPAADASGGLRRGSLREPSWALRCVRSGPFCYVAAVLALQRANAGGDARRRNRVDLHGWLRDVTPVVGGSDAGSDGSTPSFSATLEDGTGSLPLVARWEVLGRLLGGADAAAWARKDPGEKARLEEWLAGYLRGFLGKVRVSVAANGGEVAELHRVMGPGDAYDKNVAKSMGQRLEKIKADAKRERAGEGRRSAAGS